MAQTGNGPKMGDLRRTQLVSTHGPGAVVDYLASRGGATSGVTLGLDSWEKGECRRVVEPVLQRILGVRELYEPPVSLSNGRDERMPALPAARFPEWLECPACHHLRHWKYWKKKGEGSAVRICHRCSRDQDRDVAVLPARFMVICEMGHLSDFPWIDWVDHEATCSKTGKMRLHSSGAGLRNLFVRCTECSGSESLRDAMNDVGRVMKGCSGERPWLGPDAMEECGEKPFTALRGSANLYFPHIASALTIPPWTHSFREVLADGGFWDQLMQAKEYHEKTKNDDLYEMTLQQIAHFVATATNADDPDEAAARSQIDKALAAFDTLPGDADPDAEAALRRDEWRKFREGSTTREDPTFEVREEAVPADLRPWFGFFARVPRLREVRTLKGFTRRFPPDGTGTQKVAKLAANAKWLPVMETLGEGIFLALDEEAVVAWERDDAVQARAARLHDEWVKSWRERFRRPDETPRETVTPRLLLVHGLAHAVMLELSISCGYGAASLQERLYVGDAGSEEAMAGILIYTASSDTDGTLGGLEREGLSSRLSATLAQAIDRLQWCSSDPLCIKGISTTSDPMNGAACHSCLFVSETSCEFFNRSLDRTMLIGDDGLPGFFSGMRR